MDESLNVPVVFLGRDALLASRLGEIIAAISWDETYRIRPVYARHPPEDGAEKLPERGRGLAFIEVSGDGGEAESGLIAALRARSTPTCKSAAGRRRRGLLPHRPGLHHRQRDQEGPLRRVHPAALIIRLLTGNIFGFAPYFPDGVTVGPLLPHLLGKVSVEAAIGNATSSAYPISIRRSWPISACSSTSC